MSGIHFDVSGNLPQGFRDIQDSSHRIQKTNNDIAAFLQTYGLHHSSQKKDAPVPRPLARVLAIVVELQQALASDKDVDKRIDKALKNDLRRHTFLLQGIAKMYARKDEEAEQTFLLAKDLEDALGNLSLAQTHVAKAEKLQDKGKDVREKAIDKLLDDAHRCRDDLRRILHESWTPDAQGRLPALQVFLETWGHEDAWRSYDDDRAYVKGALLRLLDKIAATNYRMDDLQGKNGIHDLRKDIRDFLIACDALGGLVVLDDIARPIPAYDELLHQPATKTKYLLSSPNGEEAHPLVIPKVLYLALLQLSNNLGDIKDVGESLEGMAHAFSSSKKDKTDLQAKAGADLLGGAKKERKVQSKAQAYYQEMKENRLVETMMEYLQAA